MPKVKTHSGAKKRFFLTATGKLKRKCAYKNHMLDKKQTKQKRKLSHTTLVHQADASRMKKLLRV
jgi:large subunit ribosomal protein L35